MNKSIVLVAETGSDISPELAEKYGIYIVPMYVTFGEEAKADGTFPASDVIDYYKHTNKLPKTSGTNVSDFEDLFDRIHEHHPDSDILYLAYSAVTTVAFSSGTIAAEGRPYVHLLDTKQVSGGQASIVIRVAELISEHPDWDVEKVKEEAIKIAEKTKFFFLPTNLKFLKAGGRLSNAAAVFGSILKIVPFIDIIDGKLVATKKFRGDLSRVIPKLLEYVSQTYNFDKERVIIEGTPGVTEEEKELAKDALTALGVKEIIWLDCGGVISTHGGPRAFGISIYLK